MNVPVNNIKNGIYPPDSGKYITNFRSDGAVMRIAPIGEVVGSVCGKSSIFQQHQECSEISFRVANRAEIN